MMGQIQETTRAMTREAKKVPSPCQVCAHNCKLDRGVRRDGKVQCILDNYGVRLPHRPDGRQNFELVEALGGNTVCLRAALHGKKLQAERAAIFRAQDAERV
jgi:hypothetical protein